MPWARGALPRVRAGRIDSRPTHSNGAAREAEDANVVVIGLGIDLVHIERLERVLDRHPRRALERFFTEDERDACLDRARPHECLAARLAVKEAFLKAIGTGLRDGLSWTEMDVWAGPRGRPTLRVSGRAGERLAELGVTRTHVSISHDAGVAVAVVILEGEDPAPD